MINLYYWTASRKLQTSEIGMTLEIAAFSVYS